MNIRNPAVSGMFYPGEAEELHRQVQGYLRDAAGGTHNPKAVIVPHAGYI
ncbi:MAG: AmmeMemoRadiSam system protein B, partial [Gammaproteobacteria bacterium]